MPRKPLSAHLERARLPIDIGTTFHNFALTWGNTSQDVCLFSTKMTWSIVYEYDNDERFHPYVPETTHENLLLLTMLPRYPESTELTVELRTLLHPLFQQLPEGLSEFTFANIYLFRQNHHYALSVLADTTLVILGRDTDTPFFMLPFGLPEQRLLDQLFHDHKMMKCASKGQTEILAEKGYGSQADRDNFDYLYRRQDLAELGGRNYHKKRNLIKAFVNSHTYKALPLREEYRNDALRILEDWRTETQQQGDYDAAREGLEKMEALQLCGGIYYVETRPVAYVLGEELARSASFVIQFEKAVSGYKGLYQFINQSFAAILPEIYDTINREQDLGEEGLRHAKLSYKPTGFVEKFKIYPPADPPA